MPKILILAIFWKSMLVIVALLILSFAPPSSFKSIPVFPMADKLVHFFMYLVVSLTLTLDYGKAFTRHQLHLPIVLFCVIFPIVLGAGIELLQEYVFPPRTGSFVDVASNILGVFTAWYLLRKRHPWVKS